ncbi:MAG: hypothetical protein ABWJ42_06460 [Sulfolobales archaeon]
MAELTIRIEGLSQEKIERISKLLELLAEKSDVIESLVRFFESIERIGLTDMVKTLEEESDFLFNAISRKEFMSLVGNMMMLMYLMSNMNHVLIYELAERTPKCLERGYEEFKKHPEKKLGLLEMLNIIRSPEFASALKALQTAIQCMRR